MAAQGEVRSVSCIDAGYVVTRRATCADRGPDPHRALPAPSRPRLVTDVINDVFDPLRSHRTHRCESIQPNEENK
jgi:hypothetical protein